MKYTTEQWQKKKDARTLYLEEKKKRNKIRKQKRHDKAVYRHENHYRHFQCEMGYRDCERRGYCNGDC